MRALLKRILKSDSTRHVLCWAVHVYIRLVFATGRWTVEGAEIPRRYRAEGKPFILAFWHGRLLMIPMAWQNLAPMHMLISSHRDGRIIAEAVTYFGIDSVAGSSTKGGLSALRQMMKHLKEGDCVGITPDGPHGPAMRASEGIAATARVSGAPVIPITYATRRRKILGTWDCFHLAWPFTRGIFLWGEPIEVPRDSDAAGVEAARALIEARMNALTAEAELRMGHSDPSEARIPSVDALAGPAGE